MPYIDQAERERIDAGGSAETCGELTYVLYATVLRYLHSRPIKYQVLAEIVAALEQTKLEFFTQHVSPYERTKREENGDVI